MILAIDMGNSNIVVGGLDDNKTYFEERITTDDRKTSLEYAILLKNILEIHKVKKNDIEGSIMASVVPPLNAPISSAVGVHRAAEHRRHREYKLPACAEGDTSAWCEPLSLQMPNTKDRSSSRIWEPRQRSM